MVAFFYLFKVRASKLASVATLEKSSIFKKLFKDDMTLALLRAVC